MKLSFRWYGEEDKVTLEQIRQIPGMESIVTAVYDVPVGQVWSRESIARLKALTETAGLKFEVIESVPVHEDIKLGKPSRDQYIENYRENIRRLAEAGVKCICYNFMPVFDWTRTQLDHVLPDGSTSLVYYQEQVDQVDPLKSDSDLTLPGWDASYSREELRDVVAQYQALTEEDLWANLEYFLKGIIPTAAECGVNMAIHEDDPCWSIFGLPRIITDEKIFPAGAGPFFCPAFRCGLADQTGIQVVFIDIESAGGPCGRLSDSLDQGYGVSFRPFPDSLRIGVGGCFFQMLFGCPVIGFQAVKHPVGLAACQVLRIGGDQFPAHVHAGAAVRRVYGIRPPPKIIPGRLQHGRNRMVCYSFLESESKGVGKLLILRLCLPVLFPVFPVRLAEQIENPAVKTVNGFYSVRISGRISVPSQIFQNFYAFLIFFVLKDLLRFLETLFRLRPRGSWISVRAAWKNILRNNPFPLSARQRQKRQYSQSLCLLFRIRGVSETRKKGADFLYGASAGRVQLGVFQEKSHHPRIIYP